MTCPKEFHIQDSIYLTHFDATDVDRIHWSMNNSEITKTLAGPPNPYTEEHAKGWLEVMQKSFINETIPNGWVIRDRSRTNGGTSPGPGLMIGSIDMRRSDDDNSRLFVEVEKKDYQYMSFGFWVDPDYWGKGIMSKVLHTAIHEIGIKLLGIEHYEGDCFAGNWASRRTFEKNGFKLYKEEKQIAKKLSTGELHDMWYMALKIPQ